MNKTIVLEPFGEWFVTVGEDPYIARKSDRHEIRINFDDETIYVNLHTAGGNVRTINCRYADDLAQVVQFVDKHIETHYLPAAQASRMLHEKTLHVESLQQQIAQLQATVSPN